MSPTIWTPPALASEAVSLTTQAWRIVEAQHRASTMKLVDSAAEQELLETLLEAGKPPLPKAAANLDYLLATPFRYPPPPGGSRFRGGDDPGVFYAAETIQTACAELGYWRWRFLQEAIGLNSLEPVAHTAFRAYLATTVVDLRKSPFNKDAHYWQHPLDYQATQRFAKIARQTGLGGIVYQSVRNPEPSWCIAVLSPLAFAKPKPNPNKQTGWLTVQKKEVSWRFDRITITFDATYWQG